MINYNELVDKTERELIERGLDPEHYNISASEHGVSVSSTQETATKRIAQKEDEKVKQEVSFDSAMSNFENLKIIEDAKKQLELTQAEANLELLQMISAMGGK